MVGFVANNDQDEKILTIIIKKSIGMTNSKSMEAFIKAVENYSCKDIKVKQLKPICQVVDEFDAVKKFGSEYELRYVLDFFQRESIVMLKEYI